MTLIGVAAAMGTTKSSLEHLLEGTVTAGIAGRLRATTGSLQEFVDGGTSVGLAGTIGCTSSSLQELREHLGREGAIGFLAGLCIRPKR
jgi:hypothetical protein